MCNFTVVIKHSNRCLSQCNKASKGKRKHTVWKLRAIFFYPFADGMIVYTENSNKATKTPEKQ